MERALKRNMVPRGQPKPAAHQAYRLGKHAQSGSTSSWGGFRRSSGRGPHGCRLCSEAGTLALWLGCQHSARSQSASAGQSWACASLAHPPRRSVHVSVGGGRACVFGCWLHGRPVWVLRVLPAVHVCPAEPCCRCPVGLPHPAAGMPHPAVDLSHRGAHLQIVAALGTPGHVAAGAPRGVQVQHDGQDVEGEDQLQQRAQDFNVKDAGAAAGGRGQVRRRGPLGRWAMRRAAAQSRGEQSRTRMNHSCSNPVCQLPSAGS